jgi:uncharacterized membrane protein
MKHMRYAVLLAFAATMAHAQRGDLPALYAVAGVAADDVLQVRAQPDAASESIGSLAPDQAGVEVVTLSKDGNWALVRLNESSGWVAMRYLAPEQTGAWDTFQTPLYCVGTEPFWSLTIDSKSNSASYTALNGINQPLAISRIWPRQFDPASPVSIRFAERNGLAILRAGLCSDGMSGDDYGININLFVTEPDAGDVMWIGCCALTR